MRLDDIYDFVHAVQRALREDRIDVDNFELDHVCYRVETLTEYEKEKQYLSGIATLLGDNEFVINGRPIATYKLHTPIRVGQRAISVIELPAPKNGSNYSSGFEHAEVVIPFPLAQFINLYPYINWNISDMHKSHNPDVSYSYEGFAVKFHENSLENVIAIEKSNP